MKKYLLLFFLTLFCTSLWAQKTITGTVYDVSDNEPLVGAQVVVKNTTKGTITDVDGNYSLVVDETDKELVFSFAGMKDKTEKVGNKTVINVKMSLDTEKAEQLKEFTVSALGIKRETKTLTVAQQSVNTADLEEVRNPNIVSALSGKVAGIQVTPPSTATGSARIVIRGNSSFTGNNQPLWVVDGMPIDNSAGDNGNSNASGGGGLDMGNGAADLNPSDIESMEVLKGPNAAALYGSRATNGAIIVTTKKAKDGKLRVSLNSNTQFYYVSQWPDFQNVFGVGHMYEMIQGLENRKFFQYSTDPKDLQNPNAFTSDPNDPRIGLPLMTEMMKDGQGSRSNGAPMIGQKYIGLDGQIHEYRPNPNNVKDFYQVGHIFTNNIAVEGGTADHNFRVSFTNTNSNDIVENINLVTKNDINARFFNTLYKNKDNLFFKEVTLDVVLKYFNDDTKNRQYTNGDSKNPIYTYINMSRNIDLDEIKNYKDANGHPVGSDNFSNPYWLINENKNHDKKNRFMLNADLSIQLLKELRLSLKYGKDYSDTEGFEFRNMAASKADKKDPYYSKNMGYYRDFHNKFNNSQADFLFLFNKDFYDLISLTATFGGTRTEYEGYGTWEQITSLKIPGYMHISNSNEYSELDKTSGRKRINSLLGSATVGYKSWIFLDLTARNDWSSSLPINNCSYFYPSIGGSWIFTEMLHIPSSTLWGKLRASWAQTGGDTDPYNLLLYYNLGSIYNNGTDNEKTVTIPDTKPKTDDITGLPTLKPERTKAYELATDLRFFNNRLKIDFTYYYKLSDDQIVRSATSVASGFAYSIKNAGSIENKGIELTIGATPIQLKSGFEWYIEGNLTKNNSKVLTMPEGLDAISLSVNWDAEVLIVKDKPYGAIYGRAWARDENGNRLVKENGKPLILEKKVYFGSANPDWFLGISNVFRYKNVDFRVQIDMQKGGGIFSGSRKQGIRAGVFFPEYTSGDALQERIDYWERHIVFDDPGDQLQGGTKFDNIYYVAKDANGTPLTKKDATTGNDILDSNGNKIYLSSGDACTQYFLPLDVGYYADDMDELVYYDASYIKLRELSIGYNFPKKWVEKIFLSSARISAVGSNLWIIYQKTPKGLDPQSTSYSGNGQGLETGALPPTTRFGFDIKLTF
ncbi:MAG: SusC/RagA family TonB-linked outer membrane protein [Prevotellaceae bacterium]|jgi:TonB-linked SusC/RagA family outer membrane protein|nr:SusC/RagA family TonB-linked outer membrane protein [Prevotellaceae bacterium]